jgi:hypothetical protein
MKKMIVTFKRKTLKISQVIMHAAAGKIDVNH